MRRLGQNGRHFLQVRALAGGKLVVALTRSGGIDLETLTSVARQLNAVLDEQDPISGS